VKADETIVSPENPSKSGYEFVGWFEDPNCTSEADFPRTVARDVVFYAKWDNPAQQDVTTGVNSSTSASASAGFAGSTSSTSPSAAGVNQSADADVVEITFEGNDGTKLTEKIKRQGTSQRVILDLETVHRIYRERGEGPE